MGLFGPGSGSGADVMTFDGVTEGISSSEMEKYIASLKTNLLDKVSEQMEDGAQAVQTVVDAINKGWQGQARDKFLDQFKKARKEIIKDLKEEYEDLTARFNDLRRFYKEQDEKMMDI